MRSAFVGFAPWIIFMVVASPQTWEWAALAALVASVILAIPSAERGSLKILDVAGIVFFGVLALLAVFLDRADLDWVENYAQAISSGALALIILATLPVMPFTEQYAREQTPPEVWDTPAFHRTGLILSGAWGAVLAVTAVLGVVAESTDSSTAQTWLNWIIPIALLIGAFRFTEWYAARQHERAQRAVAAAA